MQYRENVRKDVKTAYALKNGAIVHISSVSKGLKCGCNCPECKEPLIARKGSERVHHFSHKPGSKCQGAAETILHKLAKEIISELDNISIPPYYYRRKSPKHIFPQVIHEEKIASGGVVSIDKVIVEPHFGGFKPDTVVFHNGKQLAIEVAVTHKVDKKKKKRLRKHEMPTIEIRLEYQHTLWNRESLIKLIQENKENKFWIYHPKEKDADRKFFSKVRKKREPISRKESGLTLYPRTKFSNKKWTNNASGDTYGLKGDAKVVEEFIKKHGYLPSKEKALEMWPWMKW